LAKRVKQLELEKWQRDKEMFKAHEEAAAGAAEEEMARAIKTASTDMEASTTEVGVVRANEMVATAVEESMIRLNKMAISDVEAAAVEESAMSLSETASMDTVGMDTEAVAPEESMTSLGETVSTDTVTDMEATATKESMISLSEMASTDMEARAAEVDAVGAGAVTGAESNTGAAKVGKNKTSARSIAPPDTGAILDVTTTVTTNKAGTLAPTKAIEVIVIEDVKIVEKAKKKRKRVAKCMDSKKIKTEDGAVESIKGEGGKKDEKAKGKGKAKEVTVDLGNDDEDDDSSDTTEADAKPKHAKTLSHKSSESCNYYIT
jgi:hypothetical protein